MSDKQLSLNEVEEYAESSEGTFKTVRIGPRELKFPTEWDVRDLDPNKGVTNRITDGAHHSPNQSDDGEYYYGTVSNMSPNGIDYQTCNLINKEEYDKMVAGDCKPKKGEVLFSKDGTVGLTSVFDGKEDIVLLSSIAMIDPDDDYLNSKYLSQYLSSWLTDFQIQSLKSGTAIRRVVLVDLEKLSIPLPSLFEQRKIATVLHTVDRAIEKAEEIIDHDQRLKKGIRQDIFQYGRLSDENTVLRRIGPKEYEMPDGWEVVNLSQVAEIKGGQGFKSTNYVDKGVPLVKISNVQNGYLDLQDTSYLPEEYLDEYSEVALSEGDVVLVLTRPIIGDGIKAARIEQNNKFLLNQRLAVVDPLDEDTILREYLYHLIFTDVFIDQVKATIRATHQPNLSKSDLQNFSIPVPDIEQQQNICRLLRSVEDTVEKNKSYRSHLKRIKQGLQQDLLSGTVRTTDTNIEVPDEIAQHG
jgi:type I restriction enzyme S subunit